MAVKTAAKPAKAEGTYITIKLSEIVSNTAQSRGMGVLSNLKAAGYGLFDKVTEDSDKEPIWSLLNSDREEDRKVGVTLIRESEDGICALAESLEASNQLQPIGVVKVSKGYDVVFGMRRTLATAFNHADDPKAPDTIEAKLLDTNGSELDLKLLALDENDQRKDESPIDKALTFQWLKKEAKMTPPEIGKRIGRSAQSIRDHLSLLHASLEDKRMDIHRGKIPIDKALKILKKREKGEDESELRDIKKGKRKGFPKPKQVEVWYNQGYKPEAMSDKIWELWQNEDVRKFISLCTGVKYKPFEEKEAPKIEESNGHIGHKLKIKKAKAIKLLTALGKPECKDWKNATLASKLESIVNLVEEGQQLEDEKLNTTLQKLISFYSEGLEITIIDE